MAASARAYIGAGRGALRRFCSFAVVAGGVCFLAPTALAQARTIALYVDGPEAASVREAMGPSVGHGVEIAGDQEFRAELARAGQKKPFGKSLDAASIDRIRNAGRAIGADAVIVVRMRRDGAARRAIVLVVDVSAGPSPIKEVRLDPRAREKDAAEIAAALAASLERYAPREEAPAAPAPVSPLPLAPGEASHTLAPSPDRGAGSPGAPPGVSAVAETTPAHRAMTALLDIALGAEAIGRHFTYDNGISPKASHYNLFPALGIGLRGKVFPFASSGAPWGDVGLAVDSSLTLLQAKQLEGALSSTFPVSYALGLCARIHPGSSERFLFGASVGYAVTSFGTVGPANAELPDVTYRSVRSAIDARVGLGRFSVVAAAALRAIVDPGHVSTRFYNPLGFGLDAELGTTFMFIHRLEARLAARYEQYAFSFHPPAGARLSAGSAFDQLYGVRASLAFVY